MRRPNRVSAARNSSSPHQLLCNEIFLGLAVSGSRRMGAALWDAGMQHCRGAGDAAPALPALHPWAGLPVRSQQRSSSINSKVLSGARVGLEVSSKPVGLMDGSPMGFP